MKGLVFCSFGKDMGETRPPKVESSRRAERETGNFRRSRRERRRPGKTGQTGRRGGRVIEDIIGRDVVVSMMSLLLSSMLSSVLVEAS